MELGSKQGGQLSRSSRNQTANVEANGFADSHGVDKEKEEGIAPDEVRKPSKENIVTIKSTGPEHPHNWVKVNKTACVCYLPY